MLTYTWIFRRVQGLKYWKGLTDTEREEFSRMVKRDNLDLDISEILPLDYSIFKNKVDYVLYILLTILFHLLFLFQYEMSEKAKEDYRIYFSTA